MRSPLVSALVAWCLLALANSASAQQRPPPTVPPPPDVVTLPPVTVIAPAPLLAGSAGIDRDKVPAMTQSLSADDVARLESLNLTDAFFRRIPGVSLSDPNGSGALQEIRYRGFSASPLQ